MKSFFVRFFAIIGFLVVLAGSCGLYMGWRILTHTPKTTAPAEMILTLDFSKPIVEGEDSSPLSLALEMEDETTSLFDVIRALDRAKDDARVKAVVAKFGVTQPSLSHAQEIRDALRRLAERKPTFAFANSFGSFGMGNKSYYLASAFKEIWLQPIGTVGLTSLGFEAPFAKSALESFGIGTDFMQREEYKSAMETFTRDGFSGPAKEDLQSMMKNLMDQVARGIAENKGWELEKVQEAMADGPFTATEALARGLVSRLGYEDEVLKNVADEVGDKAKQVGLTDYLDLTEPTQTPKAVVALITGSGPILDEPSRSHGLTGDRTMDADELANAFHAAAEDQDVKAILFRVDSPGGSPVASETIRHALIRAKTAGKPVFVSMGDVAASGGYWVAMDADHIVASPSTLTGSIGVVAGKYILGGMWQKLGIKWDRLETGVNAHMFSSLDGFDAHGRERMNALMDETYQAFISNVSAARKIPLDKMPDVAKGRVFTGEQALKIGLIDEVGGMETTVQAIKKHLKLEPNDPIALQSFPPPMSPLDYIANAIHGAGAEGITFHRFLSQVQTGITVLSPMLNALTPSPMGAQMDPAYQGLTR